MSLLDHVEFAVTDARTSQAFYARALAPLGMVHLVHVQTAAGGDRHGFGREGYPCLWFHDQDVPGRGTHIAFAAATRAQVDAFHRAALAAGGMDNEAPGVRERYHPDYYAAYVLDPDGVNVEVVCQ